MWLTATTDTGSSLLPIKNGPYLDGAYQLGFFVPDTSHTRALKNCYDHTETEFVNLLRSQESIPSLAGQYDNPIWRTGPPDCIGWLLKRLQIQALNAAYEINQKNKYISTSLVFAHCKVVGFVIKPFSIYTVYWRFLENLCSAMLLLNANKY